MTEYIVKTDKNGKSHIKIKFHAPVLRLKRVETLKHNGNFYNIYVNKLGNVYHFERSVVTSWKEVTKGKKKFRVPDVMEQSGATLVEVGTTNKTHYSDYEDAITENTGALLKVHTSNYRIVGFTESVKINELVELSQKHDMPIIEDLGRRFV